MKEGRLDEVGRRTRGSGPWVSAILATFMAMGAGCEVDCDERYCDFVRAAAGGIYAWEYECCLDPDSPACIDRAIRYQALAFGAPAMRMACEQENWDRVGEIWDEVKQVIPAVPLRIILRRFCGIDVAFGENVATPFVPGDRVAIDLVLASVGSPPVPSDDQAAPSRGIDPPATTGEGRSAQRRSSWVVRPGSGVRSWWGDSITSFEASGILSVMESSHGSADLDDWCRRLRPEELRLVLHGPDGNIRIDLDPTFAGNAMAFSTPDAGVLGIAVRIDLDVDGSGPRSIPFAFEPVFLAIPFRIDPDGGLRLGSADPIDAFDLWPVASQVEAYFTGVEVPGGESGDQAACALAARGVADHFLSLHASECGGLR